MWVPGGMLFLIPVIGLLVMIFRAEDAASPTGLARRAPGHG